ncbi:hypothetical protein [Paraburkholderia sp. GAS42]|uniref:hypothetical protein n=1 Tax=Paraburkholderia sp. GAS42 TaxID=3035135 RepID=UPI003D1BAE2D
MQDIDGLVESVNNLAAHSKRVSSSLGARALVLGKFLEVATPHLTTTQCSVIGQAFKRGIEDVMALMDDTALPQEFHSELLSLTNTIAADLEGQSGRVGR